MHRSDRDFRDLDVIDLELIDRSCGLRHLVVTGEEAI